MAASRRMRQDFDGTVLSLNARPAFLEGFDDLRTRMAKRDAGETKAACVLDPELRGARPIAQGSDESNRTVPV